MFISGGEGSHDPAVLQAVIDLPLTEEEEVLVDAGREFLGPLYYRHTGGGAVFGESLDIDWITKDGVIVATATNWPAEIQILVPWGNEAVLPGAVAHELLECGTGPWPGGEVRRYAKPHIVLGGGGAYYRWQPELDQELVTAARCGDAEEVRYYLRNHINVIAVVLDNVNLGPVVTYELLAELGRNGFAGKAYRMSDGDEEIRAGLAEYLLPGAAAA